jgi:tetratricopeptide (TPR) repeat protein
MKALLVLLAVGMAGSLALGDVVYLNDGTRLEGKVQRVGDGWIVTDAAGHQTVVTPQQLASMEPSRPATRDAASADAVAADRLADLRLSVADVSDPRQAIDNYKTYLAKYGSTASGNTARSELATWQDRLDRGLVKYGGKWVEVADLSGLESQDFVRISQAGSLITDGHVKEGMAALAAILADDPHNAPALYVQGIGYFDLEQIPNSRKSLEAANAAAPHVGAALNNLGVVLYRQKQYSVALGYYDQAMLALPGNTQILDNVLEAMNSLPDSNRQTVIAQKVAKVLADQDAAAQKQMAAKGLVRWGATWIDQTQADQIKAAQEAIAQQVSTLQSQIAMLDQQTLMDGQMIDQNTMMMQQIQANSFMRDPTTGNVIVIPYPPNYYTMMATSAQLEQQIQSGNSKESSLRQEMARLQQQPLPVPKFTGVQHMMGPEQAVTLLPPGATTQPDSAPPPPKDPWRAPATQPDAPANPVAAPPVFGPPAPAVAPAVQGPGDVPIPAPAMPAPSH